MKRRIEAMSEQPRSILSEADRRRPAVRAGVALLSLAMLAVLVLAAAGPLVWLFKSAVSTSQDILRYPFAWWPSGIQWGNLAAAWNEVQIGKYVANTVWVAAGSWFATLLVATTGGYTLSVLRPRYAKILSGAILATLFIPGVISLVPLYLTVLDVPIVHLNLVNSFWAIWLPNAADAVSILLVRRFFDALPGELFEAAKLDGAGPFRVFRSLVLPMSKPIIGVLSLLAVVRAWKDFLWPLLVLPDPTLQPLSVALARLQNTELALMMAGMFISVIIPVALFLMFQRQFLRGAGQAGALKG